MDFVKLFLQDKFPEMEFLNYTVSELVEFQYILSKMPW